MEPVVLALEEKYEKKVEFVIADLGTGEGRSLAEQYNFYYIPFFFLLDPEGNVAYSIGYEEVKDRPLEALSSYIDKVLGVK